MELHNNHFNIKYIKLINHIATGRKEWSADLERGKEFDLGWIITDETTEDEKPKTLARKKKDAEKAVKGDRILLCQNNCYHGHRATHVVEVVDEPNEVKCVQDTWIRKVRIVFRAENFENAPRTKEVVGEKFSFRSGYLISVHAPSIKLNLAQLKI
jgi:hypothetical protein